MKVRSGASDAGPPSSRGGRRRRRKRSSKVTWRSLALSAVGVAVALSVTFLLLVFPSLAGPSTGRAVELDVAPDAPRDTVVAQLRDAGLLRHPRLFALYARLTGLRPVPGPHVLTDEASAAELVRRLERRGGAAHVRVTFPEGFTRFDMAKRLAKRHVTTERAFLAATEDRELMRELGIGAPTAEGYLFPATYDLPLDAEAKDVARRLKAELDKRVGALEQAHPLGRAELERSLGWTRHEILTLASVVEKEAAVDEERATIASVFLNRLRDPAFRRKVLQSDPTSGYGCVAMGARIPSCAGFTGKITPAMNRDPANPYSTYAHTGLPPGPICNPSASSVRAVLAPASTRYLYFVARGGGRHAFSERLEEHDTAVKDLKDRKANEH